MVALLPASRSPKTSTVVLVLTGKPGRFPADYKPGVTALQQVLNRRGGQDYSQARNSRQVRTVEGDVQTLNSQARTAGKFGP